MTVYVYRAGQLVDKDTGEAIQTNGIIPTSFQVRRDIPGYDCPVTGKWIEGRRAHEENLKQQGCRIVEKGEKEEWIRDRERAAREQDRKLDETIARVASEHGVTD
jgi:hypothetical protein